MDHFIQKYSFKIGKQISGVSPEAMEMLHNTRYPGNIRELENEIERAVTLADDGAFITPELISLRFQKTQMQAQGQSDLEQPFKQQVQELEIKLIKMALNETGGNVLQAAEKLKLSRAGLHKKLKRYHLDPKNL